MPVTTVFIFSLCLLWFASIRSWVVTAVRFRFSSLYTVFSSLYAASNLAHGSVSLLLGGMLFAVAFFILVLHLLPTCVVRASGSSTHSLRLPICVSSCVTVSRRLSHVAMPSHNLESPLWQALKVPSILPPCFLQSSLVSGVRSGARHPLPSRLTPLAPFPSGLRPTSFASGLLPLPPASTLPLCVRHGSLLLRVRPDALLSCGLFFENGY